MKLPRSALGDHVHRYAGITSILRLVVIHQNLDLGNRIHAGGQPRAGSRTTVQIGRAIDGEVVGAGPVALHGYVKIRARGRLV